MFEIISKCEGELTKYLEIKKKFFPRFYFLDSEALLDVLSNGNQPTKVEKYLSSVFISLSALEFVPKNKKNKDSKGKVLNSAYGMYSKENEYVKFDNGKDEVTIYEAKGEVENWLCDLEAIMRLSLQVQIGRAWFTSFESWQMPNMNEKDVTEFWETSLKNSNEKFGNKEEIPKEVLSDFYYRVLRDI